MGFRGHFLTFFSRKHFWHSLKKHVVGFKVVIKSQSSFFSETSSLNPINIQDLNRHFLVEGSPHMFVDLNLICRKIFVDHTPVCPIFFVDHTPVCPKTFVDHTPVRPKIFVDLTPVCRKIFVDHTRVCPKIFVDLTPVRRKILVDHTPVRPKNYVDHTHVCRKIFVDHTPAYRKNLCRPYPCFGSFDDPLKIKVHFLRMVNLLVWSYPQKRKGILWATFRGYDGTFVGVMHMHSLVDVFAFQWPFFSL